MPLQDARHYFDVAARRFRANPAQQPMPAPAEHGARWVLTFWPHLDEPAWAPADHQVTLERSAAVRVNHGRWLVDCPCGSAQLACQTDRRMFCVDCRNADVSGWWVPVLWPADPHAVEALLEGRPVELRNWEPGESVTQLRAENIVLAERARATS